MRNISAEGLAKLAQTHGNESIILLEVDWREGSTARWYADRDVATILGRILEVGGLDNVVGVSANVTSQSIDIVLDDTDGSLKTILDGADVHKRTARVYQYFYGLDLVDKFLLFAGKISSPVIWNERDRTVKFTIISQLEDREIGFSAEEGQFPYLPADLVVLSACRTALGREVQGEGLIGLTRGFMYAGAARVAASLWNVDDAATAELMARFYRNMFGQDINPAAALRAAQLEMSRQRSWLLVRRYRQQFSPWKRRGFGHDRAQSGRPRGSVCPLPELQGGGRRASRATARPSTTACNWESRVVFPPAF